MLEHCPDEMTAEQLDEWAHHQQPVIESCWRYSPPPDTSAKALLLTKTGVCIQGAWGSGLGVMAWCPQPRRDKEMEAKL